MIPSEIEQYIEALAHQLATSLSPIAAAQIIRNIADMVEALGETKQ